VVKGWGGAAENIFCEYKIHFSNISCIPFWPKRTTGKFMMTQTVLQCMEEWAIWGKTIGNKTVRSPALVAAAVPKFQQ